MSTKPNGLLQWRRPLCILTMLNERGSVWRMVYVRQFQQGLMHMLQGKKLKSSLGEC